MLPNNQVVNHFTVNLPWKIKTTLYARTVEPLLSEMAGKVVYIWDLGGFQIREVKNLSNFESLGIRLLFQIKSFF